MHAKFLRAAAGEHNARSDYTLENVKNVFVFINTLVYMFIIISFQVLMLVCLLRLTVNISAILAWLCY